MRPRTLTLVLFLLASPIAAAAETRPAPGGGGLLVSAEHLPLQDLGIIDAIMRDDDGFVWFGGTTGIGRYDGYQMWPATFTGEASDRALNVVAALPVGKDSAYLATGQGLWRMCLSARSAVRVAPGDTLFDGTLSAITRSDDGTVWFGVGVSGVVSWQPQDGSTTHRTTREGLSNDRVTALAATGDTLWIGTRGGLNVLDRRTGRVTVLRTSDDPASIASDEVTALLDDRSGRLWVGTARGLAVLDERSGTVRRVVIPKEGVHAVWSVALLPTGSVIAVASGLGMITVSPDGVVAPLPGLEENEHARALLSARSVYVDPAETAGPRTLLWVATRYGVEKIVVSRNPFSASLRGNSGFLLDRGAVLTILEARDGTVWAGLWGGGLNGFRRGPAGYVRTASFSADPSSRVRLPHQDVTALLEDRDGNLWIGTADGLAILDRDRAHLRTIRHVDGDSTSLAGNSINDILEGHDGTIWIATDAGLSSTARGDAARFRNEFHATRDVHPLGGNHIAAVYEDGHASVWVATYGRGVFRREADGTWHQYRDASDSAGRRDNFVYALAPDTGDGLWLSTSAGLEHLDVRSGKFRGVPLEGFSLAHIHGIMPDNAGGLWLSTTWGLARIDQRSGSFERFAREEGLPFEECFSPITATRRGTLLVGGIDGFVEFAPQDVASPARAPQFAVTGVSIAGKELDPATIAAGDIALTDEQNFVSFSFAVLEFASSGAHGFAYQLEGVDPDWVDARNRSYATYPNLAPGHYVFRVRGRNGAQRWSAATAVVAFRIAPHYWQTWYFQALVGAVVVGGFYAGYRYRLRKVVELERLRLRIAGDLHDDVGSNLSTIAIQARAAERSAELPAAARDRLADIYDTAVATSESLKDIVWFVKPENDSLDGLVLRMKDVASAMLTECEHEFRAALETPAALISVDLKRNVFLAYREALTNIVRHANAHRVEIAVEQRGATLTVTLRDDGRGFDPAAVGRRGNGLGNLRQRTAAIGGSCAIEARPGGGTTIRLQGALSATTRKGFGS